MGPLYYGKDEDDDEPDAIDPGSDYRVELGESNYGDYDNIAILPHSCGSWSIGGKKQVREMISDLRKILRNPKLIEDCATALRNKP